LTLALAGVLPNDDVKAMKPLDNIEEFMAGPFRMPATAVAEGPIPDRLAALPRDRSALPQGVWLQFQNFGSERYRNWSTQMRIDEEGKVYLVSHLGDATSAKVEHPAWQKWPTQELDAGSLAALRQAAAAFAAGPAFRGYEGLSHAPVFVLTVNMNGSEQDFFIEGYENEFVRKLRSITYRAQVTPLGRSKRKP
jgi:hypothetical protein